MSLSLTAGPDDRAHAVHRVSMTSTTGARSSASTCARPPEDPADDPGHLEVACRAVPERLRAPPEPTTRRRSSRGVRPCPGRSRRSAVALRRILFACSRFARCTCVARGSRPRGQSGVSAARIFAPRLGALEIIEPAVSDRTAIGEDTDAGTTQLQGSDWCRNRHDDPNEPCPPHYPMTGPSPRRHPAPIDVARGPACPSPGDSRARALILSSSR